PTPGGQPGGQLAAVEPAGVGTRLGAGAGPRVGDARRQGGRPVDAATRAADCTPAADGVPSCRRNSPAKGGRPIESAVPAGCTIVVPPPEGMMPKRANPSSGLKP